MRNIHEIWVSAQHYRGEMEEKMKKFKKIGSIGLAFLLFLQQMPIIQAEETKGMDEKAYPKYLTAREYGEMGQYNAHYSNEEFYDVVNGEYHCNILKNHSEWNFDEIHYVILKENAKDDEIAYVRCDVYEAEKSVHYIDVTFVNSTTNETIVNQVQEDTMLQNVPSWGEGFWTTDDIVDFNGDFSSVVVTGPMTFTWHETQKVYAYARIEGDIPEGAQINKSKYYTIGWLNLPIVEKGVTGNILKNYEEDIRAAIDNGNFHHEYNTMIDLTSITWEKLFGTNSGGEDYQPEGGFCWHLDGKVSGNKVEWVNVTFLDGVEGENQDFFINDKNERTSEIKVIVPKGSKLPEFTGKFARPGFKFTNWDQTLNEDVVNTDLTLTAQWVKNENDTNHIEATVDYSLGGKYQTEDHVLLEEEVYVLDPQVVSTEGISVKEYIGWSLDYMTINGKMVTELPKTLNDGDHVVYHYQLNRYDVITRFHFEGINEVKEVKGKQDFGSQFTVALEETIIENSHHYMLDKVENNGLIVGVKDNIVDVYYTLDENKDHTPDKYQVKVTYEAINGTVSIHSTFVTLLDEEGKWSLKGVAHLTVDQIAEALANEGYGKGQWNVNPTVELEIKKDTKFVITFVPDYYHLRINYLDDNQNVVAESYTADVLFKESYSVVSPVVEGYSLKDEAQVTVKGTMGSQDVEVDVVYVLDEETTPVLPPVDIEVPPTTPTEIETPTVPEVPGVPVTPEVPVSKEEGGMLVLPQEEHEEESEELEESKTPQGNLEEEVIEDSVVPLAKGEGSWALVNLICSLMTVLLGLLLILSKRTKEEDETEEVQKRGMLTRVFSVGIAALSILVFFLTEDVSLPMVMVDDWTLLMVLIALVQGVVLVVGRRWKSTSDDNQTVEFNKENA